ncbi:hypothetical protein EJ04DRAFT_510527 [Polyplosphaeria fusca]|uniref:HMG box domain-containing protein n=1 Tax=Polyplosphaeria fusca TaxID=682080 RepID=A0A9P4R0Y3_9PLEO|nr:hypothetical protein EJ04DRAFT_510527 [Polyplosphaeria fusca]
MTRQKKEDTGELLVSLEQFTRTRDSVIVSLTNLQSGLTHVQTGLSDLLRAYMQHTASIISGGSGEIPENLQLPANITAAAQNALTEGLAAVQSVQETVAPVAAEGGKRKRKREKKERDPNAPKRPLTAAFLYAQAARPIVKQDLEGSLGPNQKLEPNAVNLEVNKRWNEMPEDQKEKWRASYRDSMEKYKLEDAEYKKSLGADVEIHDEEDGSDEAEVGAVDSEEDDEDEEEATPITKAPTPPAGKTPKTSKRQKTAHVNGNGPVPIAPAAAAPTPIPVPVSGGRVTHILPPGGATETPAKKATKAGKKAGPQAIAPAPAVKEPSPDDGKKKTTKSRTTRNTEAEAAAQGEVAAEPPKSVKKRDRSKRKSEGAAN